MLIARRNLMSGKPLPYDAEVEYIESDGDQYISLGVGLVGGDSVSAHVMSTVANQSANIVGVFGARNSVSANNIAALVDGSYGFAIDYNNSDYKAYRCRSPSPSAVKDVRVTLRASRAVRSVGNPPIYANETYCADVIATPAVYLFAINGVTWSRFTGRFYWFNIDRKFNLVPVRVCGEGAMYDRVSGKLFRNAGTGAFVIGPDKASGAFSTEGGGTKCLTPRRSYRRLARPSARFYSRATSQRWEVAA